MSENTEMTEEAQSILVQRREALAKRYEAEAQAAMARAEMARLEGKLIEAGFHFDASQPAIW